MDTPSVSGFEERRVRSARRFGRIGLMSTLLYLLLVPVPLFLGALRPGFAPIMIALYVTGFGLHLWRIRELMQSLGRPATLWFTVAASAVGLAVTAVGLGSGAVSFTGRCWAGSCSVTSSVACGPGSPRCGWWRRPCSRRPSASG